VNCRSNIIIQKSSLVRDISQHKPPINFITEWRHSFSVTSHSFLDSGHGTRVTTSASTIAARRSSSTLLSRCCPPPRSDNLNVVLAFLRWPQPHTGTAAVTCCPALLLSDMSSSRTPRCCHVVCGYAPLAPVHEHHAAERDDDAATRSPFDVLQISQEKRMYYLYVVVL
jgi:hypothetical protein